MADPTFSTAVPVPDPSTLTTEQLDKAIDGLKTLIESRLDGMDTAILLRMDNIRAIHGETAEAIKCATDLQNEKFRSVDQRFTERDIRSEREARDNKVAVDAAFAAQKEAAAKQDEANAKAIDKSEKATAETIKTNQELTSAKTEALTKNQDEMKLQLSRIEASKVGRDENGVEQRFEHTSHQMSMGNVIALVTVCIFALSLIISAVAIGFHK